MKAVIVNNHDLPPEWRAQYPVRDDMWRWILAVEDDAGAIVEIIGADGGEPEDQILPRDWVWVRDLAQRALDAEAKALRLREALGAMDCRCCSRCPSSLIRFECETCGDTGKDPVAQAVLRGEP